MWPRVYALSYGSAVTQGASMLLRVSEYALARVYVCACVRARGGVGEREWNRDEDGEPVENPRGRER